MRISLPSLARLAIGTMIVSSAAAIGLARLAPPPKGWRMPSPVRYANVNTFYLDPCHRGSSWIDREGGPMRELSYHDEELLEYASCSPWRDEQGRAQVVGRWSWSCRSDTPDRAYGLARVSFPDGEVLDHVETDVVPVSSPCWYPGTGAKILFAAGDGKLYQWNFEADDDGATRPEHPIERLRPIVWNCEFPDGQGVYLAEPHWSSDPEFSRLLFVSLRTSRQVRGLPESTPAQIWWLRLGEDGGSVEQAGRLIDPPASGPDVTERCPSIARIPDGRTVLAYFRKVGLNHANLYLVDIELDSESRCPRPSAGIGTKIAEDCLSSPPIFSGDGRWITIIREGRDNKGVPTRIRAEVGTEAIATVPSR